MYFFRYHLFHFLALGLFGSVVIAAPGPQSQVRDLAYGETLYDFFQQDYFSAITRLEIALQKNELPHHRQEAELLHGGLLLSYGLPAEAEKRFNQLLGKESDPTIRNQVWFHLAKVKYRQGYPDNALKALEKVKDDELPLDLREESRQLRSLVLMDLGKLDAASRLLIAPTASTLWAAYARFNLGVTMIRSGQEALGHEYLAELGETQDLGGEYDDELLLIRDKANLALAYIALQHKQPEKAAKFFRKIRLKDSQAYSALLGLGWAEFARGNIPKALTPWFVLSQKEAAEPAVQEALLAIPYGLTEARDFGQAELRYQKAIDIFVSEQKRLDSLRQLILNDSISELFLNLGGGIRDLPEWQSTVLPEPFRNQTWVNLISGNEFQSVLRNTRDLHVLGNELERWQGSINAFRDMLALRRKAYEQKLPRVQEKLARLDMATIDRQRDEYAARLLRAEPGQDALATAGELELLSSLKKTRDILDQYPENSTLDAQREKLRLLEGVFNWRLSVDHQARLWAATKQIKSLDSAIRDTENGLIRLRIARNQASRGFEGYGQRIDNLEIAIKQLSRRVHAAIIENETYLYTLLLRTLQQQHEHLKVFETQARFGLARVYDLATGSRQESP